MTYNTTILGKVFTKNYSRNSTGKALHVNDNDARTNAATQYYSLNYNNEDVSIIYIYFHIYI